MECYTYLRNVTDLLSDGKTPYERSFGQPFKGPIIPFGSLVEYYYPFTAKDQSRIHQFGKKVLPGLFLGYALYAGGFGKGDALVADLEELETMDASEIYSKRLFLCLKLWKFLQQKQRWTRNGKNWRKIPAWNLTKARNKKEVIEEARTSGAKVHFASTMDICHLKNAELEMVLSRIMRTQLVFEMMIFRKFFSKWDGILLSMTKIPPDDILVGLYKLRIRQSEKLKTVLELYNMEIHQKKAEPDYHKLKALVKRSIEQEITNEEFWGQKRKLWDKRRGQESEGTKQRKQRSLRDCWQWKATGQCSEGDNCSFRHDMNKRAKSTQPNPSPRSSTRQSVKKCIENQKS